MPTRQMHEEDNYLASVSDLLAQHFPANAGDNPNELPDAPVVV